MPTWWTNKADLYHKTAFSITAVPASHILPCFCCAKNGPSTQKNIWLSLGNLLCVISFSTDSGSGPYRRYDRLPPIQAQFSIESDSDMTESSGLIQEYDVFDPLKPRPHIIFIIGERIWVTFQGNTLYNLYSICATTYCFSQN